MCFKSHFLLDLNQITWVPGRFECSWSLTISAIATLLFPLRYRHEAPQKYSLLSCLVLCCPGQRQNLAAVAHMTQKWREGTKLKIPLCSLPSSVRHGKSSVSCANECRGQPEHSFFFSLQSAQGFEGSPSSSHKSIIFLSLRLHS